MTRGGFADPGCTQPVSSAIARPACGVPTHAIRPAVDICGFDVATVAEPVAALYVGTPGTCFAYPLSPGEVAHAIGDPIDPAMFALLERDWVDVGRRLVRGDLIERGGLRVYRNALRDSAMQDARCEFQRAGGELRCLPAAAVDAPQARVVGAYGDPGCSEPLQLAQVPARACTEVFDVGEPFTDPLYRVEPTGCATLTPTRPVYRLGDEISLDRFAVATEAIE